MNEKDIIAALKETETEARKEVSCSLRALPDEEFQVFIKKEETEGLPTAPIDSEPIRLLGGPCPHYGRPGLYCGHCNNCLDCCACDERGRTRLP